MIIAVSGLKGGIGKTTTALALAEAAARDGKRARVLDADPQASASLWAMAAQDAGDELAYSVESANLATVRALAKRFAGDADEWVFVDCPPNGKVVDEAVGAADMVVVPTTTSPADMVKTFEAVDTLEAAGKYHAVLLTRTLANTVALRETREELRERDASWFDAEIPQREVLKGFFGNAFGEELYGYDKVYEEIKEGLEDGD